MSWQAHHDAHAQAVFRLFENALKDALATAAPDWLLHHVKMVRERSPRDMQEEVHIRLVLRPIGFVREVPEPSVSTREETAAGRPPALPLQRKS